MITPVKIPVTNTDLLVIVPVPGKLPPVVVALILVAMAVLLINIENTQVDILNTLGFRVMGMLCRIMVITALEFRVDLEGSRIFLCPEAMVESIMIPGMRGGGGSRGIIGIIMDTIRRMGMGGMMGMGVEVGVGITRLV